MKKFVKLIQSIHDQSLTGRLRDEHQKLLLNRTRVSCITAPFLYAIGIFSYNALYHPESFFGSLVAVLPPSMGCLLLLYTLKSEFVQKHYQWPLFIILTIFTNFSEAVNYHLTGGLEGWFFFPYFLIYIAITIYYPATLGWVVVTCFSTIPWYVGTEALMDRNLFSPKVISNVLFLIDSMIMAIVGNRIIYRLYIRDKLGQFALEQANAKLAALDKAKSEFFANVSHELKTPMTLVVTPLENAMRNVPKGAPEVVVPRQTIETVRHNAYRLSSLISDLLDLTKSEIGKARISPTEIPDTKGYFEGIFNSVTPLMQEKGLQFEFVVGPPDSPQRTSPDSLRYESNRDQSGSAATKR